MSKQYQGHKNRNHWNVSLWINNDYSLYTLAKSFIANAGNKDQAAQSMMEYLRDAEMTHTPDGVKYSKSSIRAAMMGM